MDAARPPEPSRAARVVLGVAVAISLFLLVDNLSWVALQGGSLRGTDYLFAGVPVLFLLCVVLRPRLARKVALSLTAAAVLLALFEVALAVASPSDRAFAWYVWPPRYAVLLEPKNLPGVSPRGRITTNSRGIRGPEFAATDRGRVLCVGGSTTECLYLDDEKTWPHVLGQLLETKVPGVWVGNVGRAGRMTLDHVTLLENLPEAETCGVWIVLAGLNDLRHRLGGEYDDHAERTWELTFPYRRPGFSSDLRRPFQRNLYAYDLLESARRRLKTALRGYDGTVYQDVDAIWVDRMRQARMRADVRRDLPDLAPWLDDYERLVRRIAARARERGARLAMMTQPVLWAETMPPENVDLCLGARAPDGRYYALDLCAKAMDAYNLRLKETCAAEGVTCLDVASLLPKSSEVLYDDCHFNEEGARRVASLLAELVAPYVPAAAPDR
jgi:lysophospholipase L1-like esterase